MHLPGPEHGSSDEVPLVWKGGRFGGLISDGRVCWLGRWDKCRLFFVVMLLKEYAAGCVHLQVSPATYHGSTGN